jgi:succinate-acetate transporter protein
MKHYREMAVGNTFGATALSSYGGFWIAYAILLSPNWGITDAKNGPYGAAGKASDISSAVGFFLTGWWIFTTLLLICTLKSTVMFFMLFFTLDLAFLMLSLENYAANMGNTSAKESLQIAGGFFGMCAAFLAWYIGLAGIQDSRYVNCKPGYAPFLDLILVTCWLILPSQTYRDLFERPSSNISCYSNSFFVVPLFPFPWSDGAKAARKVKSERATV